MRVQPAMAPSTACCEAAVLVRCAGWMACILMVACEEPPPATPQPLTTGTAGTPAAAASITATSAIASSSPKQATTRPRHRGGVPLGSADCAAGDWAACQRGCEKAAGPDCYWLARRHAQGDGVDQNIDTALRLYTRACDGGVPRGCYHAGRIHDDRNQPAQAERLLKRACAGGDYLGCKYAQSYEEPSQ